MNRRTFLAVSAGAGALARAQQPSSSVPGAIRALKPMTDGVNPITPDERRARIDQAQGLMAAQKIGAVFMERGSSMFYFSGTRNLSGLVIPAKGEIAWIVPLAQEQQAHEGSQVGGKVFNYTASDGPSRVLKDALKDCGVTTGRIGLEEQVQFSLFDGMRKEIPTGEFVNAAGHRGLSRDQVQSGDRTHAARRGRHHCSLPGRTRHSAGRHASARIIH
jgi:Xaa-Pro dipeptidase